MGEPGGTYIIRPLAGLILLGQACDDVFGIQKFLQVNDARPVREAGILDVWIQECPDNQQSMERSVRCSITAMC
jgi:hypothetical protein